MIAANVIFAFQNITRLISPVLTARGILRNYVEKVNNGCKPIIFGKCFCVF